MVIDKLENLFKYSRLFGGITQLSKIIEQRSLIDVSAKEVIDDISLIPIVSEKIAEVFDSNLLEAHRRYMDIHITLKGLDVVAYAHLQSETNPLRAYRKEEDYLLCTSKEIKTLNVPEGYFCIIPNDFAHMALYVGHHNVRKIVVKLPNEKD